MAILPAVAGFLLIFGGWKMRHGEQYWLCVLAACVPFAIWLEKLVSLPQHRFFFTVADWSRCRWACGP